MYEDKEGFLQPRIDVSLCIECHKCEKVCPILNQETIPSENADNQNIVDLEASDWILYNDGDSMMEIKNPNVDINVKIKKR